MSDSARDRLPVSRKCGHEHPLLNQECPHCNGDFRTAQPAAPNGPEELVVSEVAGGAALDHARSIIASQQACIAKIQEIVEEELGAGSRSAEFDVLPSGVREAMVHFHERAAQRADAPVPATPLSACKNPDCPVGCPDSHTLPMMDSDVVGPPDAPVQAGASRASGPAPIIAFKAEYNHNGKYSALFSDYQEAQGWLANLQAKLPGGSNGHIIPLVEQTGPAPQNDALENLADYLLRTKPPYWNYEKVLRLAKEVAKGAPQNDAERVLAMNKWRRKYFGAGISHEMWPKAIEDAFEAGWLAAQRQTDTGKEPK